MLDAPIQALLWSARRNCGGLGRMSEQPGSDGDLRKRIESARDALNPKRGPNVAEKYRSLSSAWRMTLELVVGTCIGVAIGLGLDSLFGTMPLFLIAMGLLGFAAGIRTVMATAEEMNREPRDERPDRGGDAQREDESDATR